MNKKDGRKLSTKTQQKIRYIGVELCNKGNTFVSIAKILNVHPTVVSNWWKLYKKEGYTGLIIKKRGVKIGTNSSINFEQTEILRKILINKTPDQFDLNFSLWTRQAIQILINKLWNITVSLVTIGRYMKKLGFTPQKPIKRAYEQNPKAVKKWLDITYPKIAKRSKKESAEIHWLDETGLNSYSNYLRGYAPIAKTPIIRMKAKRLSINIISSISKLGKMRFMTYKNSLNTKIFIKFISRLCKDVDRKVFVIMDNLAVHHSKKFMAWLEKRKNRIEVFYLPSYSPELNPDERLNRDLKTHFHSGSIVKNEKEFKKKVTGHLRKIQKMSLNIKNYFNSRFVEYAA
jgi:transposase